MCLCARNISYSFGSRVFLEFFYVELASNDLGVHGHDCEPQISILL